MILLHPHKVLIKIIMKKMMNQMIESKRREMIKGEMRMMRKRKSTTTSKSVSKRSKRSPHR
jgi:hypothetical protein